MAETIVADVGASPIASASLPSRGRRIFALALVLGVSFAHFATAAFYYLLHPVIVADTHQRQLSLVNGIIAETTSLLLLWFVLSGQQRTWNDIGWDRTWSDIPRGVGLVVITLLFSNIASRFFQGFYFGSTGHYLQPRTTHGILGASVSALSIVFILINPFFEEMIVRAYTMSEVMGLGGSPSAAILISVFVQMSYHVYQGVVRCIALTVTFTIFSIYFAKTRRIAPIVVAHLCMDAYALYSIRT